VLVIPQIQRTNPILLAGVGDCFKSNEQIPFYYLVLVIVSNPTNKLHSISWLVIPQILFEIAKEKKDQKSITFQNVIEAN